MVKENLLIEINKIHTTSMGVDRIRRNLKLDNNIDVVAYCIDVIRNNDSKVELNGKNYYVTYMNMIITVNKYSYTIITAHLVK